MAISPLVQKSLVPGALAVAIAVIALLMQANASVTIVATAATFLTAFVLRQDASASSKTTLAPEVDLFAQEEAAAAKREARKRNRAAAEATEELKRLAKIQEEEKAREAAIARKRDQTKAAAEAAAKAAAEAKAVAAALAKVAKVELPKPVFEPEADTSKMTKAQLKKYKKDKAQRDEEERQRVEAERKRIEEERKRLEDERKRLEAEAEKKAAALAALQGKSKKSGGAAAGGAAASSGKTAAKDSAAAKQAAAAAAAAAAALEDDGAGWTSVSRKTKSSSSSSANANGAAAAAANGAENNSAAANGSKKAKKGGAAAAASAGGDADDAAAAPAAVPQTTAQVSVEEKQRSLLMGTKGATLKLIEEGTGAKIEVPKKEDRTGLVRIVGTADAVRSAKAEIESLLTLGYSSVTDPGFIHQELSVEPKHFGTIIGKGGEFLSSIQKKTKTRIHVPSAGKESEPVRIVGLPDDVLLAALAIKELIANGFSLLTHEGYERREVAFPREKLPFLIGTKGQVIRAIEKEGQARINIAEQYPGYVVVIGPTAGLDYVQRELATLLVPQEVVQDAPEAEYVNGTWFQRNYDEQSLWN